MIAARGIRLAGLGGGLAAGLAALVAGARAEQPARAQATPERLIDLASATPDLLIAGAVDKDQLGNDLRVGDLNADGRLDLAIGAHWGSIGGRNIVGRAYVVFGRETWPALLDLNIPSQRDWSFMGAGREARMGSAVAVGDLNRDGVADLALGSLLADPADQPNAGAAYVMHGGRGVGGHLDFHQGTPDVFIAGASDAFGSDRLGTDAVIGDFNGDGRGDLAVAAVMRESFAGGVFVWWGPLDRGRRYDLAIEEAGWTLLGHGENAFLGAGLQAGDLNADGIDDLVATALAARGGPDRAGAVHVFFGQAGAGGTIDLAEEQASVEILGSEGTQLGAALSPGSCSCRGLVAAVADLTGDGQNDLIVGAPLDDGRRGGAYLFAGPLSPGRHALHEVPHLRLAGDATDGRAGWALATGHLDRDGQRDLVVAAPWADPEGRTDAGLVYGLRGPLPERGTLALAEAPLRLLGPAVGAGSAAYTAALADTDGDGSDDLHLGLPDTAPLGRRSVGSVWVLRGPLLDTRALPATATITVTATPSPEATPSPSASPTPTAQTPSPEASPSPPASASPTAQTPSPEPSPTPPPTPAASPTSPPRPSATAQATPTRPSRAHLPFVLRYRPRR